MSAVGLPAHLHAAAALAVCSFLLCMGLPRGDQLRSKAAAQQLKQLGPAAPIASSLIELNAVVRQPLTARLNKVERLFRIRQLWTLYGDGPYTVRRLEVWIDDELAFRSLDAEHRWRALQLRQRRVRPMVENLTLKAGAHNWKGMGRFIVSAARADFPDTTRVALIATKADYGAPDSTPTHGQAAAAPDWQLSPLPAAALRDSTP